jgi:hypothetical protein
MMKLIDVVEYRRCLVDLFDPAFSMDELRRISGTSADLA